MKRDKQLLAMLASKEPMFDSPVAAWEAGKIRDGILESMRRGEKARDEK